MFISAARLAIATAEHSQELIYDFEDTPVPADVVGLRDGISCLEVTG